jgi:hypothetical protein
MNEAIPPSNTVAVVVGIEAYPACPNWNVRGPAAGARRFAAWLRAAGVPADNIRQFLSPVDVRAAGAEGPGFEPATRERIYSALFTGDLLRRDGRLVMYWSGHGLLTADGKRRLLYADATRETFLNLDVDGLLASLRSDLFRFAEQWLFADACAQAVAPKDTPFSMAAETYPAGTPAVGARQFAMFAAQPGELAYVPSGEAGIFSQELLAELEGDIGGWPPDLVRIAGELKKRFVRLRALGHANQAPTFYSFRDWDAAEHRLGGADISRGAQANPLRAFPRGGLVPFHWIPPSIVKAFAELCYNPANPIDCINVVNRANLTRQRADPQDPARGVSLPKLPPPATVAPEFFWTAAFTLACPTGPRTVASLLLMLPEQAFEPAVAQDWDWLLRQLLAKDPRFGALSTSEQESIVDTVKKFAHRQFFGGES